MLKITYKNSEALVSTVDDGYRWLQNKGASDAEDIFQLENAGVWKVSIKGEWSAERISDLDRFKS